MPRGERTIAAGQDVGGEYQLQSLLGEGGMALVYRARHVASDRSCAVKLIHPELLGRRGIVDKFIAEAQLVARLPPHPHIVRLYHSGVDQQLGAPFIVMELVEGKMLCDLCPDMPMPSGLVRLFMRQLAEALTCAHAADVVHRDLKPNNLIIERVGDHEFVLKVLDFGIAKVLDRGAAQTATEVGTPMFCAPEQLGSTMRKLAATLGFTIATGVSPATDIWAMGLIAYQLLTGHPPSQYWNVSLLPELMVKIALQSRELPSERAGERGCHLPPGFDQWFLRCVEHDAARRWQSARRAAEQLDALFVSSPAAERTLSEWNTLKLPKLFAALGAHDPTAADPHMLAATEPLAAAPPRLLPTPTSVSVEHAEQPPSARAELRLAFAAGSAGLALATIVAVALTMSTTTAVKLESALTSVARVVADQRLALLQAELRVTAKPPAFVEHQQLEPHAGNTAASATAAAPLRRPPPSRRYRPERYSPNDPIWGQRR